MNTIEIITAANTLGYTITHIDPNDTTRTIELVPTNPHSYTPTISYNFTGDIQIDTTAAGSCDPQTIKLIMAGYQNALHMVEIMENARENFHTLDEYHFNH